MAALAKVLAVCAGTVGGAAACVATGVVPAPLALGDHSRPAPIEREARAPAAPVAEPEAEAAPETPQAPEDPACFGRFQAA